MLLRFFDLETRGTKPLKDPKDGTPYGLAVHVEGLTGLTLMTWQDANLATGEIGPVMTWEPPFEPAPTLGPVDFWVAYNARYDRLAWNRCRHLYGLPELGTVLDLMVQCRASGLPDGLARTAGAAGLEGKLAKGAMLEIYDAGRPLPARDSAKWKEFVEYGVRDTELLWPLWQCTHKLRGSDWAGWLASERINDRGLPLDLTLAEKLRDAARLEDAETERAMVALCGLTPRQSTALTDWVWARVGEGVQEVMTVGGRPSLNSKTVLPELLNQVLLPEVREVLALLEGAKSPAAAKADGILRTSLRGRALGCYVFNGASTGRYSSRGVQVHNLSRPIPGVDLVPALLAGDPLDAGEVRLPRALASALRGCIRAGASKTLVWADWSAIEARVLPWLAWDPTGARTAGRHAERVLALFRGGVDIYQDAARGIYRLAPGAAVTKEQRFAGKIAVLACGFGGGLGAYQRMAAAMGVTIEDDRSREIVAAWREANPWAVWFWAALETAWTAAWSAPGVEYRVGRVAYRMEGRDLLCRLPSGRSLVYRGLRRATELDQWKRKRVVWTYQRGGGRVKLWPGLASENCTQAVAADLLREALVEAVDAELGVVGHTHDEIILEVAIERADEGASKLRRIMETSPTWAMGLPLAAEIQIRERYGK